LSRATLGKTFEMFDDPGAPPIDWSELFTCLAPDGEPQRAH
jgi:hypothetical protein